MAYFHKRGKIHLLQTMKLKEHLEITIQVFHYVVSCCLNIFVLNTTATSVHKIPVNLYVVDVVEIGDRQGKIGEVLKVKPLAALAMIDEGELDWKIVAISLDDPKASLVNDVDDVEKHFPVSFVT